MGNEWTPTDWTKASRADWDRIAEETCREGQERFDRMSDEDWLKEIEQEWDGPISVSAAHFMSLSKDGQPPTESAPLRKGALSKLASWIAMKLAFVRGSGIRPS